MFWDTPLALNQVVNTSASKVRRGKSLRSSACHDLGISVVFQILWNMLVLFKALSAQNVTFLSLSSQHFLLVCCLFQFAIHCLKQHCLKHLPINIFDKCPLQHQVSSKLGKMKTDLLSWSSKELPDKLKKKKSQSSLQMRSVLFSLVLELWAVIVKTTIEMGIKGWYQSKLTLHKVVFLLRLNLFLLNKNFSDCYKLLISFQDSEIFLIAFPIAFMQGWTFGVLYLKFLLISRSFILLSYN